MRRRTADLTSAIIVALWVLLLLTGLPPAYHLMNANDLLTPVSNMAGLVVAMGIIMAAAYGGGMVAGLLAGGEVARLLAVGLGCATTLFGLGLATDGLVPSLLNSPRGATAVLLSCIGGPLLVVAGVAGGLTFPPGPQRGWNRPHRPRPQLPHQAAPPSWPVPDVLSAPPGTAGDYWASSTTGATAPPELPSAPMSPERGPFWENFSGVEWLAFAGLASAVVLGTVWLGTRWHHGAHPVIGLALVTVAILLGREWDRRR